jgi:single-strand DNA-binding protein
MMINTVVLVGRLVRDPELRYTTSGVAVARFTVAVNRKRRNSEGERETDFFRCVAWAKLAELIAEHAGKGKEIGIEGELRQNRWETEGGEKRETVEIFLHNMMFLRDAGASSAGASSLSKEEEKPKVAKWEDFDDDDLPF